MWHVMTDCEGVVEYFDLFSDKEVAESVAEDLRRQYEPIGVDVWVQPSAGTTEQVVPS